jgi:hypothetical protein
MDSPSNSRAATVVATVVASPMTHPSIVVGAILPVIVGAVVSFTLMICMAVVEFKHASVTTYILVTTIGHVPVEASLLVTTKNASAVHASLIDNPRASSAATVVTADVAFAAVHPSTVVVAIVPLIDGGVASFTLIICVIAAVFEQASVTK